MSKKKTRKKHSVQPSSQPNPLAKDNPVPNMGRNVTTISSYSGPIPHPQLLAEFDAIIPNGADRILKMAEAQSEHRRYIEKWAVIGGTLLSYLGVVFAAVIAICALYFGADLVKSGYSIQGTILSGVGLASLVCVFIYGTRARSKERERKERMNRELTRR